MFSANSGGGKRAPSRDGFDIYVGHFPETTTEDQLRGYFQQHGEVLSTTLRQTYGFVRFAKEEDCNKALQTNRVDFYGTMVNVRKGNKKQGKRKDGNVLEGPFTDNKPDLVSNHKATPKPSAAPGGYKPAFRVERREQLVVSHVETPVTFWAQNVANSEIISDITLKLQSLCPAVFPASARPMPDKVYAAKFSEDDNWYRCKIENFHSTSQVEVSYIDYGNSEVRDDGELVELPPGLQQPPAQATKYILYGLNPMHPDRNTAGFEQGKTFLKSLVEQRIVTADIVSTDQRTPCIPVILSTEDEDVNQLMLDKGHAERKSNKGPGANSGGNYAGRQAGPDSQQSRFSQPKSKFTSTNKSHVPHKAKSMEAGDWESPIPLVGSGSPIWLATKGSSDPMLENKTVTDSRELENLSMELARAKSRLSEASAQAEKQRIKYQHEIDRLTTENLQLTEERNSASLQLATTKGKLKAAESTASQLSDDAVKNDFSLKLRTLLRDINRVRMLRSQFPTDDSREDLIENAILLLTQEDPLKGSNILKLVEDVEASAAAFNVIQNRIRSAKSVDEVGDILAARDDARCELFKKMEEFLEAVEKLPIDNSSADFQMMVHCLEETYEPYTKGDFDQTNLLLLEEIETQWSQWKVEHLSGIQEVRTDVNTCHNKVDSLLSQLHEQLRLNASDTSDVNSSCLHLPVCVTDLQGAIDKEIALTDLEDKIDQKLPIRDIVRSLIQSCMSRLEQLGVLKAYKAQYEGLKQKLAPWLHSKPDLQEVLAMRKNIRACNSKLRHRLADKLDLEEADDSSAEEMLQVKEDITQFRNELQVALAKQDELVSNIREVILNQFPELALEYADLGIKTNEVFSLVREGRSLDHFDLEPFDDTSKGVYKSTFCGKPVLLKEYLLDESLGLGKTDFLMKAQTYDSAQSEYLVPLEAIFFTKNERQAVIQVPRYNCTLAEKVSEGNLEFKSVENILRNVVEGVIALHRQGLLHGAINPQNIFLTSDNKAVLNIVDLVKSPEQRMLSGDSRFVAPELLSSGQVALKSDCYSLGVLAYWLNMPDASPLADWPLEAQDTPLHQLVVQLMERSPSDRPDAADLLSFPFFKTRMMVSRDTLQLRMKSACSRSENGGILKNSSPVKEHLPAPPDVVKITEVDASMPVKSMNEGASVDDAEVAGSNGTEQELAEKDEAQQEMVNGGSPDVTSESDSKTPETPENDPDDTAAKKNMHANSLASQIMFQNEGTPTLPCTPMDTPSNTPVESENNTPAKVGSPSLVQASLETLLTKKIINCVQLEYQVVEDGEEENDADDGHVDSDDGDSMPALEDGTLTEITCEEE